MTWILTFLYIAALWVASLNPWLLVPAVLGCGVIIWKLWGEVA